MSVIILSATMWNSIRLLAFATMTLGTVAHADCPEYLVARLLSTDGTAGLPVALEVISVEDLHTGDRVRATPPPIPKHNPKKSKAQKFKPSELPPPPITPDQVLPLDPSAVAPLPSEQAIYDAFLALSDSGQAVRIRAVHRESGKTLVFSGTVEVVGVQLVGSIPVPYILLRTDNSLQVTRPDSPWIRSPGRLFYIRISDIYLDHIVPL